MNKQNCRACAAEAMTEILAHPSTPLFIGTLHEETPAELRDLKLPISLSQCGKCGLVQQPDNPVVNEYLDAIYRATHENACSGTKTGEGEFGRERAMRFLSAIGKSSMPATVLEIGCNAGHMLKICKELGAEKLVGVEPSMAEISKPESGITILPGYFTKDILKGETFEFAYLIEVLEHIPSPHSFLKDVHASLRVGGQLAISVPNCESGLEYGNIGMPIHEHLLYFTPHTLSNTLRRAGFKLLRLEATFSHLYCLAERCEDELAPAGVESVRVENFGASAERVKKSLADFISSHSKPIGLYGACSLTANLAAWAPELALSEHVVIDSDPHKWGLQVSGCPGKTMSPTDAIAQGIRDVVVMPFGFQENIADFITKRFPDLKPGLLFPGMAEQYEKKKTHELKPATADDFAFYFEVKSEPSNVYWCGYVEKPDQQKLREWFAANIQRSDRDVLIYHVGGAPVGYAYIDKCSGHLETSVAVSEKFEGRGLGTKLMADVVDYIGAHYEQQPIVAWIIERNIASVKIHEKAGYRRAAGTKTVPFGSGASEKMVEFRVVAERH